MQRNWARLYAVSILALCVLMLPRSAQAVRTDMNISSLRGLSGVHVIIQNLDRDLVNDGLSQDAVQTAVEQRLRQAGVKVMSEGELDKADGGILFLAVNSVRSDAGIYACDITAELIQVTSLTRAPDVLVPASTWTSGMVAMISASNVSHLRDMTLEVIDQFTKDFHTANAAEPPKLSNA